MCKKGGEIERDRWDLGKLLSYFTSMDVNLCFSASLSADLHKLWHRYLLLPFQLARLTLIPGLHYLLEDLNIERN